MQKPDIRAKFIDSKRLKSCDFLKIVKKLTTILTTFTLVFKFLLTLLKV